jgi:sugar/nucleoside kinase (ribokinase family)
VDLICVGDVMLDVHARFGRLARGGDVHGRVMVQPGGTSANTAVWAAWTGAKAAVVASVGDDLMGELLTRSLTERGVDVEFVRRHGAPTGTMLIALEEDERSMVADRGANATLAAEDLPATLEAGAVLVSGYLLLQEPGHETALAALERARTDLLAVEAASWPLAEGFGPELFFDETATASVVFANDDEARVLTGLDGVEAARALGERYRVAAVKRGPEGAALVVDGVLHEGATTPVEEVDPTGAGDAFDGVLLASLVAGAAADVALEAACRAGTLVVGSRQTWPGSAREPVS